MIKEPQKRNLSSMQVLKTLNMLLEGDYTMAELLEKLNAKEKDAIFNNSVVSKYINTCRFCGFNIVKMHNKYFVVDIPFGIHLDDSESDAVGELKNIIESNMSVRSVKVFNKFLSSIERYASKKIAKIEKNNRTEFLENFEKAVAGRKVVQLIFKNSLNTTGIPLSIKPAKGRVFAHIYDGKRERMIDVERLSGIKTLNESYDWYNKEENIVYVLKGNLAKRYEIKPDEQLLKSNQDGTVSVVNKCKNLEVLISRLLRYDDLCEILKPSFARKEIKQSIDETLKNYGIE